MVYKNLTSSQIRLLRFLPAFKTAVSELSNCTELTDVYHRKASSAITLI